MKYFLYSLIFLFFSCSNSLRKDLSQLSSNIINMPVNAEIQYDNSDTYNYNYFDSKYKLIVYTDSMGCCSCNISKMHLWQPIIKYTKLFNGKLNLFFIFSPSVAGINNMRLALSNYPINYPIIIDTLGEFEKLNPHLPKNKAMHTFLLDENNKVILVGNPLYNKEIEKLFYKKTQELLSK